MAADTPDEPRFRISACIVAMNEEDRIGACIDSVAWCDETIVVDSHSTDRTREIAAEKGARVIERDWPGFGAQKTFAAQAAEHDWILSMDADERVSGALRDEIQALQRAGAPPHAGYSMPRRSSYLGRYMSYGSWRPTPQLRLFDRSRARWGGHEPHDKVFVEGGDGALKGEILHHPYRSFAEHMRTIEKYTTIMANGMKERGRRVSLAGLIFRPVFGFLRYAVLQLGLLDGWRGVLMAFLEAHYIRLKYAKLYLAQKGCLAPPPPDDRELL